MLKVLNIPLFLICFKTCTNYLLTVSVLVWTSSCSQNADVWLLFCKNVCVLQRCHVSDIKVGFHFSLDSCFSLFLAASSKRFMRHFYISSLFPTPLLSWTTSALQHELCACTVAAGELLYWAVSLTSCSSYRSACSHWRPHSTPEKCHTGQNYPDLLYHRFHAHNTEYFEKQIFCCVGTSCSKF